MTHKTENPEEEKKSKSGTKKNILSQIKSIPTSRVSRLFRTGWAARHTVPMALRRTVELMSADKGDRKEITQKFIKEQKKVAEELYRTLGTLKGVALKAGQMASYIDGVLPQELEKIYQQVLSKLQSGAPGLPPITSQKLIKEELGKPADELFASFDEVPFAAASIGQVHKGVLHDGTHVAVKLQYPEVDKAFESDLKNFKVLEKMFGPVIRHYNSKEALDLAVENLLDELDYVREYQSQERFRTMFLNHEQIRIPKVFKELSTSKILVSGFCEGLTFEEICKLDQEERNHFAQVLVRYNMESLFLHCFINPDPHPGNYIFHDDHTISFLDFGAAYEIDSKFAKGLQSSIQAIMDEDKFAFRRTVHDVFGISRDNLVVFDAYCRILDFALTPFKEEAQPFCFSSKWIESYLEFAFSETRNILTRGKRIPRLPPPVDFHSDIIFVERIAVGLASLLSKLSGTADWNKLAREVFGG